MITPTMSIERRKEIAKLLREGKRVPKEEFEIYFEYTQRFYRRQHIGSRRMAKAVYSNGAGRTVSNGFSNQR